MGCGTSKTGVRPPKPSSPIGGLQKPHVQAHDGSLSQIETQRSSSVLSQPSAEEPVAQYSATGPARRTAYTQPPLVAPELNTESEATATFPSEDELSTWLSDNGVGISEWGTYGIKTIGNLWEEVRKGWSELTLVDDEVVRRLHQLSVKVLHGSRVLVETRRLEEDGRIRQLGEENGGNGILVNTKLRRDAWHSVQRQGVGWQDAAKEAIRYLGLTPTMVKMDEQTSTEDQTVQSKSYPGLRTEYLTLHAAVHILPESLDAALRQRLGIRDADEPEEFLLEESRKDGGMKTVKTRYFSWMPIEAWRMTTLFRGVTKMCDWLKARGLDPEGFGGRDKSKTPVSLFEELRRGECLLEEADDQAGGKRAVRRISKVSLTIRYRHWTLRLQHRLMPDGQMAVIRDASQTFGRALEVVMLPGGSWQRAAARGLDTFLGLKPGQVRLHDYVEATRLRVESSASYPGLATEYILLHASGQLAAEMLTDEQLKRLGLGFLAARGGGAPGAGQCESPSDFYVEHVQWDGSLLRYGWSWVQAARMRSNEAAGKVAESPEPSGQLMPLGDAARRPCVLANGALQASLLALADGDAARKEQVAKALTDGLPALDGRISACVRLFGLTGGRAAALVFRAEVTDERGQVCQFFVGKFDAWSAVEREAKLMQQYASRLTDGHHPTPKLLGGAPPKRVDLAGGVSVRLGTSAGLLAMDLAGSDWLLPEFSLLGGTTLTTLGELCRAELELEARTSSNTAEPVRLSHGQLSRVVSNDLFGSAQPMGTLTHVYNATVKRAAAGWEGALFATLKKRIGAHEQQGPVGGFRPWHLAAWFTGGGQRCAEARASLTAFVPLLEALPSWAASTADSAGAWAPLIALTHGDLHAGSVMVDLHGSAWLIDFEQVKEQLLVFDMAKLFTSLVFEHLGLSSDEELAAACRMSEGLFAQPPARLDDVRSWAARGEADLPPRVRAVRNIALRLLEALPGALRAAADGSGGATAADLHPLAFLLALLERTLRLLTYHEDDLDTRQRQWVLCSAAAMATGLHRVWHTFTALEAAAPTRRPPSAVQAHEGGALEQHALVAYRRYIEAWHATVYDAITGVQMRVDEQCIEIPLREQSASGLASEPVDVHSLLAQMQGQTPGQCLVLGDAGAGKTVLLKQLIYYCSRWHLRSASAVIPILVGVRDLLRACAVAEQDGEPLCAQASLHDMLGTYIPQRFDGARKELLAAAWRERRLLLLLDGVGSAKDARKHIEACLGKYSGRVLATSRDDGFGSAALGGLRQLRLEPISSAQQQQLVAMRMLDRTLHARISQSHLLSHELVELCHSPLMLSMVLAMLQSGLSKEATLSEIYYCVVRVMLLRHDQTAVQREMSHKLLMRVAFHCGSSGTITEENVQLALSAVENAENKTGENEQREWSAIMSKATTGRMPGLVCSSLEPLALRFTFDACLLYLYSEQLLLELRELPQHESARWLKDALPAFSDLLCLPWWKAVLQLCIEQHDGFADLVMQLKPEHAPGALRDGRKWPGGAVLFAHLLRDGSQASSSSESRESRRTHATWLLDEGMPFDNELQLSLLRRHRGGDTLWHTAVQDCESAELVARVAKKIPSLVTVPDLKGRVAYDLADKHVRELIDKAVCFGGCYRVTSATPEHVSPTTVVLMARAVRDVTNSQGIRLVHAGEAVVIKLMRHAMHLRNEIENRLGWVLDSAVVPIIGASNEDNLKDRWADDVAMAKYDQTQFPHGIVLKAGQRNLMAILIQELLTLDKSVSILKSLVDNLAKMHEHGKVHGDLKPLNVVRMLDGAYRLIDLDACTNSGEPIGLKTSTAYVPPEMFAVIEKRHAVGSQSSTSEVVPLAAAPSFDAWSLGVVMYRLLAHKALFEADDSDNIQGVNSSRKLRDWGAKVLEDALESLSLALLAEEEQHTSVQAERPPAAEMLWQRVAAVDLLSWLLTLEPERRPTMFEAQRHALFRHDAREKGIVWRMSPVHVAAALGNVSELRRLLQSTGQCEFQNERAPEFEHESDLAKWLGTVGVDASQYGKHPAKPLSDLFKELRDSSCELTTRQAPGEEKRILERHVRQVQVMLRHEGQLLIETHRVENGTVKPMGNDQKGRPPTFKMHTGEDWRRVGLKALQGAMPGLKEEEVRFASVVKEKMEVTESQSFPGFTTVYDMIIVDVTLDEQQPSFAMLAESVAAPANGGQGGKFEVKEVASGGHTINRCFSWLEANADAFEGTSVFSDKAELNTWLESLGVDTAAWNGAGRVKTVAALHTELMKGECKVEKVKRPDGSFSAARQLTTVKVTLGHTGMVCVEKREIMGVQEKIHGQDNGGHGRVLVRKMLPGELWQQTAHRALKEEFGLTSTEVELDGRVDRGVEHVGSASFPGLPTQYLVYKVKAELRADQLSRGQLRKIGIDGTAHRLFVIDSQTMDGVLRHCWAWENATNWRLIEERVDAMQVRHMLGKTPLHMAAVEGHVEAVQVLLESGSGVDVNAFDDSHKTALHAVLLRIEEVRLGSDYGQRLLFVCRELSRISDCNLPDASNRTASALASASRFQPVREIFFDRANQPASVIDVD